MGEEVVQFEAYAVAGIDGKESKAAVNSGG